MEPLITSYALRPVNLVEIAMFAVCLLGVIITWPNPRFRGLGVFLITQAALMLFNFSEETGLFGQNHLVTPAFTLLTGPVFYFFVRHLVFDKHRWRKIDFLHLLPACVALPFTADTAVVIAAGSGSLICYGIYCYRILLDYSQQAMQSSSAADDMSLNWIRSGMILFALLGLTDLVRLNLQSVLSYEILNTWYLLHHVLVLILFGALIVFTVKQPLLFNGFGQNEPVTNSSIEQDLFRQIDKEVKEHEWHLIPRISVGDVADKLGLGIKDVSGAINVGSERNFCDYINALRIDEVKRRLELSRYQDQTLLGVALDCGFNSKTSFNSAFKKLEGCTPSQYRKTRQDSISQQ